MRPIATQQSTVLNLASQGHIAIGIDYVQARSHPTLHFGMSAQLFLIGHECIDNLRIIAIEALGISLYED